MIRFYIETYGCQMNVSDSELVTSILLDKGFVRAANINEADVIIFNTCSVRQHAENRVIGRISNELSRKNNKPNLRIGVIGCMAQRLGEQLRERQKGVDFVVGVDAYEKLPGIILGQVPAAVDNTIDSSVLYSEHFPESDNPTCGFVTIMRGCNNFCSYCIVPYLRGSERSRPYKDIIADVQRAGRKGQKDITLLGQNVNSYLYKEINFPKLLHQINGIADIHRIRFITSHPKDLSDELIEVLPSLDKVCEHIHLPLQSGDNEILAKMNRGYSIEHYLGLVSKLRTAVPGIAITTDMICGFPSESESAFDNSMQAMRQIRFDYTFCFKYSQREGTSAYTMVDQVDEAIRLNRLQRMIDLQREITLGGFRAKIGNEVEIYVEGFSKKSAADVSGKTRDFKIAVLPGVPEQIGTLVKATVSDATSGTLICRPTP